jgi:Bacterial protein of unknown function (DUF839)
MKGTTLHLERISAAVAVCAAAALCAAPTASAASFSGHGPSTGTDPYVIPADPAVSTVSLLTTGDSVGGYRMGGIPDGLGAFDATGRTFRLFMNHELGNNVGVTRGHGEIGAYVSDWTIDRATLAVRSGEDLIRPKTAELATTGVQYWDYGTSSYSTLPSATFAQTAAFHRFCSSTLTDPGQLLSDSGAGYPGQLYFANEEGGSGRTFAVTEDGTAQQLPRLGLYDFENTKPAYNTGLDTVVAGLEDDTANIWLYHGTKQANGAPAERAGLTNGSLGVVALDSGVKTDAAFRAQNGGDPRGVAYPWHLANVDWNASKSAQKAEATAAGGVLLTRIEDGTWDPRHPDTLYFNTTAGGKGGPGRTGGGVWKLVLDDVDHPEQGGTLTLLLDGSEPPYLNMQDNMTIDKHGNLLLQEDPGNNAHVSRIVAYSTVTGELKTLATFNPAYFQPGAAKFITQDEESSGIIPADRELGGNSFLFDAQIHAPYPDAGLKPALVEQGQLLAMRVDWEQFWGLGA